MLVCVLVARVHVAQEPRERAGDPAAAGEARVLIVASAAALDPEAVAGSGDTAALRGNVESREKPVVAFVAPPGAQEPAPRPADALFPAAPQRAAGRYVAVVEYLRERFDVHEVSLREGDGLEDLARRVAKEKEQRERRGGGVEHRVEDVVRALVVVGPEALDGVQAAAVAGAVRLGIGTVVLAGRWSADLSQAGISRGVPLRRLKLGPELESLLATWGVELPDVVLASNSCAPIHVTPSPVAGGLAAPRAVPVAAMLSLGEGDLEAASPLLASSAGLVLPFSSGLRLDARRLQANGTRVEVHARAPRETWSVHVDAPEAAAGQLTLASRSRDLIETRESGKIAASGDRVPLAVLLRGRFAPPRKR
jgi:hypothetical protein